MMTLEEVIKRRVFNKTNNLAINEFNRRAGGVFHFRRQEIKSLLRDLEKKEFLRVEKKDKSNYWVGRVTLQETAN